VKSLDIAIKDLVTATRSLFALGMMVVVPLLITGMLYLAFGNLLSGSGPASLPELRVAVANQDEPQSNAPQLGAELVSFLRDEAMPDWLIVEEVSSATEARARVNDRQAGAAVVIPANFTQALVTAGSTAELEIVHDPTLTVGPGVLEALLGQFVDGVSGARIALDVVNATRAGQGMAALDVASQQALAAEYTTWFTAVQQDISHGADPVLTTQAPGAAPAPANSMAVLLSRIMAGMMIFFAFYGGAYTAMSIVTEDELGTLARLFTTPTSRAAVLGGKFLSIVLTLAAQIAVLLTVSAVLFRIHWGTPAAIAGASLGLVVAAAGFGLLLMAFIKTTKQGGAILGGVLSLFGLLGGLMTVAVEVPPAMQQMTLLTPQGWALRAWDMVLSGQSLATLLTPVAVLVGAGLACLAAGIGLARRRFA
jgi:ABC-2 type transport system permease protein